MNRFIALLMASLLILAMSPAMASERYDGVFFTIVDENGNVVYMTGRHVKIGDQCITENNKRFEIIRIEGDTAHAKYIGDVNLSQYLPKEAQNGILYAFLAPKTAKAQGGGRVAIYHTHSDESYVPSDGKESKLGAGGIYDVGKSFANALKAKGIEPLISEAKHDPHDDMAYERSRRTVASLIKQKPDAVFDIHRDAVPPQVYKANINGQDVTKIQLVVGKYGATAKQIEDYALKIKAAADQKHPGLVKGIFFAKGGDYNQDLHPRSMLLEVGAHTNTKEAAERGIALFADVVPSVLGQASQSGTPSGTGATGMGTTQSGPSGAAKSIGWILGLLVVGGGAFLLLSTGGLKEAGAKLKQFTSTEFANFLGRIKRGKKNPSDGRE
ncbi:MAG: stage II sporulation protein P [Negativicutes bacterium]|nr:stage II sporulation protein P [Negativicutes bacterium]